MSETDPSVHTQAIDKPYLKKIRDIHQQVLVLQDKTLIAVPEDGVVHPTMLTSTPCRDMSLENGKGSPIYLGIVDPKLCLCCEESGGQPTLELKEKDIMELHHAPKAEKSFVFHVNTNGSISTFQSAAFPGWFISSSAEQGKPVKMTKDVGKDNTAFHFDPNV